MQFTVIPYNLINHIIKHSMKYRPTRSSENPSQKPNSPSLCVIVIDSKYVFDRNERLLGKFESVSISLLAASYLFYIMDFKTQPNGRVQAKDTFYFHGTFCLLPCSLPLLQYTWFLFILRQLYTRIYICMFYYIYNVYYHYTRYVYNVYMYTMM